jgi:hypothetical protein
MVVADNPVLTRAADEIARLRPVHSAPLSQSSYWERLCGRQDALAPSRFSAILLASTARLGRRPPVSLQFGSWHGDWTPWNLTVANGRVRVWDWEKFQGDVPIGFDTIHYPVHGMSALEHQTPRQAFELTLRRAPRLLHPHRIGACSALVVFWLYVLELATRYLEDGEGEAGTTPMSQLGSWLQPVLEALERRVEVSAA